MFDPSGIDEINARFAEADASLVDLPKRDHPVIPAVQIAEQYPNQWVAVETISVGAGAKLVSGRVFAAAPDRRALQKQIRVLRRRYPGLVLIDHFTGRPRDAGRHVV